MADCNVSRNYLNSQLDKLTSWKTVATMISRLVARANKIEDPVLRFSVLTQLISFSMDAGLTAIMASIDHDTSNMIDEDSTTLKLEITRVETNLTNIRDDIEKLFEDMSRWIANPVYGPDHPFGANLMKQGQASFQAGAQQNNKSE
jgi:hypothetical protein